jgi:hypothetical protein
MIDLGFVKLDWTVNAGQLLVAGTLTLLGWGLRRFYRGAMQFVKTVHLNDKRLDDTEVMVDRHSQVMVNRGDLGLKVRRLHRRRDEDSDDITPTIDAKARI